MTRVATVLFVYAHPDDESFGIAGTAMKLRDEGHITGLLTLTRGDVGMWFGKEKGSWTPEELAREQHQIADDVSIGTHSIIEHHVTLGRGVRIHSNAFIPEFTVIEDNAWIGPNVVIFTISEFGTDRRDSLILRDSTKVRGR